MQVSKPRLYVIGDRRDAGKTVVSMGLMAGLQERYRAIRYIKPTSQLGLDGDLMQRVCPTSVPANLNPVLLEGALVKRMILADTQAKTSERRSLEAQIANNVKLLQQDADFLILEGSGYSAVGDCIDLSNGDVARILKTPVLLVIEAGIGSALDQLAMQITYLRSKKARVLGVVLNYAAADKKAQLVAPVESGLKKWGVPLLGIVPLDRDLALSTVREVFEHVAKRFPGEVRGDTGSLSNPIGNILDGSLPSGYLRDNFRERSLLVLQNPPTDQEDFIKFLLSEDGRQQLAGIIYLGKSLPDCLKNSPLPLLNLPGVPLREAQDNAQKVVLEGHHKIHPDDTWRIETAKRIATGNIDLEGILKVLKA